MTRRLLASFLLPPGIFVLLFAVAGIWNLRKGRRLAAAVHLALGALLWFLSVAPGADLLVRGLEAPYEPVREPAGDVIVVLGGGIADRAPDLSGTGAPSEAMLARIVTAARLQKRLGVPVIVSGGTPSGAKASEASVARRFLTDLGVPADRIVAEDRSRDTRENAAYTAEIARRAGHRHPVLVTSAFHMRRAAMEFRRAGFAASPCPADFQTWAGKEYAAHAFLPDGAFLHRSSAAIRERAALLVYGRLLK